MHINLRGLFNSQDILVEQQWCYLIHSKVNNGVLAFSKSTSPKRDVIAPVEIELANYEVTT